MAILDQAEIGDEALPRRLRLFVRGAVQGIGFRPFVYRLARQYQLTGWVRNGPQGAEIEVEGSDRVLTAFVQQLTTADLQSGVIQSIESEYHPSAGYAEFEIRESLQEGTRRAFILPDLATCADCRRELFDPADRRFRYPFMNCTACGPRFSIIQALPYDRPNTTMRQFSMCAECRREYADPADRRFHAQPIACPNCGPTLALWDHAGRVVAERDEALRRAADAMGQGKIVALKGLGGFQFLVDARNEDAVRLLRKRKHREEKPFALMVPSLELALRDVEISAEETRLLESPQAPILLVRRRETAGLALSVAPRNPYLGVMLPYTPLHHLLMADLGFPIVATSGNVADEPICIDENDALKRLASIADLFLTHNRPIARPMDDSIARVVLGREQVLRRARGYAPWPITLKFPVASSASPPKREETEVVLAVGPHLKNTVAVSVGDEVFVSQHVGDLETAEAATVFEEAAGDLPRLYDVKPTQVACDLHPDFRSTRYAERLGLPITRVQHHVAHVLACMAEHGIEAPVLGVAWDGAGLGTDGAIWGGEFFHVTQSAIERVAHLRPFPLPGAELAMRESRRSALGLLYAWLGDAVFSRADLPIWNAFTPIERNTVMIALRRQINTPMTTSVGRLFDAAAALAGVCFQNRFEGQSAMEWEWSANRGEGRGTLGEPYPMPIVDRSGILAVVDWGPLLEGMLADVASGVPKSTISVRFHAGLIEAIVGVCHRMGEARVVLTGGCFLNRILLEGSIQRLTAEGFHPYWHHRVPTGDGGIALGQIVAASRPRWNQLINP